VTKHIAEILFGVELIAKTYGIRKIVAHDDQILPMAFGIISLPFLILVLAMLNDSKNMRKAKENKEIEAKKAMAEKKNK
jgi:hypothetical protein